MLSVVVSAVVARTLSVEEFGVYSFVVAAILFGRRFVSAGLDGILTQSLIESPAHTPRLLTMAVVIRAAWGAMTATAILAYLLSSEVVAGTTALLLAAGLIGNIALCAEVIDNKFQADEAAGVPAKARTLAWFIISAAQIIVLLAGGRAAPLLATQAAYPVVYAVILFVVGTRHGLGIRHLAWSLETARRLISDAWPLLISALGAAVYVKFGSVMLGLLAPANEVAIYAIAAQLVDVWHIFPPLMVAALFPRLIRLNISDKTAFKETVSSLFALLFNAGVLVCVGYWLAVGTVIDNVFGARYTSAALVASILVLTVPFAAWGALLSRMIITERAITFSITRHLAGGCVGLLSSWLLIPQWGAVGAAVGAVSAFTVACYIAVWADRRMRPYASLMIRNIFKPRTTTARCIALMRSSHEHT